MSISKWACAIAAAIAFSTQSGASAASGPSTPYNQCPAVGAAPSCGILLVVNPDNSVSVLQDPAVGPYDGGDDTLVGIVNNSTSPVPAVTVSGPGSYLAGFDGDGLCSYAGCSNGPTGYEGPGTSFVTNPSNPDSAEVDFGGTTTAGLAPGATAYFSLEGALTSAQLTVREGHLNAGPTILFVHGLTQIANDPGTFGSLFDQIRAANPGVKIENYVYFQDKSAAQTSTTDCNPTDPGQTAPVMAATSQLAGLPYDASQNTPAHCDSAGDIGQNAVLLDRKIRSIHDATGQKVIVVGYSMGGETIRAMLALSTATNDGVANDIDSVITMHGVQQGSWLAVRALQLSNAGWGIGSLFDSLISKYFVDPHRPAIRQFTPEGDMLKWIHANSANLPNIPYYNTYGDEQISIRHCFFFGHGCVGGTPRKLGDIVLLPGTDSPTQNVGGGGARFAPRGYTPGSWQWGEYQLFQYDPVDDNPIDVAKSLYNEPMEHSQIVGRQSEVMIPDCQTGQPVAEDTELARVITARLNGTTYACNASLAPSN